MKKNEKQSWNTYEEIHIHELVHWSLDEVIIWKVTVPLFNILHKSHKCVDTQIFLHINRAFNTKYSHLYSTYISFYI